MKMEINTMLEKNCNDKKATLIKIYPRTELRYSGPDSFQNMTKMGANRVGLPPGHRPGD